MAFFWGAVAFLSGSFWKILECLQNCIPTKCSYIYRFVQRFQDLSKYQPRFVWSLPD